MRDFNYTVGVLINAYLSGKLERGYCGLCAVGNILNGRTEWSVLFLTDSYGKQRRGQELHDYLTTVQRFVTPEEIEPKSTCALIDIRRSGYTVDELAEVEFAFETAPKGSSLDDSIFNGLVAAIDALAKIHNVELGEVEQVKQSIKQKELTEC